MRSTACGELARASAGSMPFTTRGRERDVPLDREMREEIVALEDDADLLAQLAQVGSGIVDRRRRRTRSVPPWIGSSPLMQRSMVLLPEPERPMMAMISPASTVSDTPVEHGVGAEALDDVVELNERHGASVPGAGSTASAGSRCAK